MFGGEPKKSLAIVEIGNEWLKIAEARPSARGMCITKAKFIRLAEIKGHLSEALSKIFKDMKLSKYSVVACIPRHLTNVRMLELPSTDPNEISDMVNLQVGKQTPYSKEEIVSAHSIIDTEREGYIKAILVIARRNIITERIDALTKSGIGVDTVALSSEGVFDWFNAAHAPAVNQYFSKAIALIDIDSNYSDFIVIYKGKMVFTRNIFIGASNINQNRAEWQERFVEELKRSIERYQVEGKNIKIEKIFLSGAARNITALDSALAAGLDTPVETTSPARNIPIKKNVGVLPDEDYRFVSPSALFGLALGRKAIELDLTPQEVRINKLMEEKRNSLTVTGVLLAAIALMCSCLLLANIYNKRAYLNQLKGEISRIKESADEVRNMRLRINLVEKRLDAKGSSINILNEMHSLTPREIYFTNINIAEKGQAVLRGRARAMSDVFKFVTTLEDSPYFKNAKTTYTTTKKEEEKEYADFEIICMHER
jgi:type IV pilus assembly protein PilM